MIEVLGLSKGFYVGTNWHALFEGLSFTIARGEFVALTGESGCGKTTLLNLIGGLDQPDKGAVLINKTKMATLSPSRRARFLNRHVGFIFQAHHLLPEQTSLDNVMLPMRIGGWARRNARQRATELMQNVRLGERLSAYPPTMSGGEKQRTAIARALATKPAVLLADEPTGSLNPEFKEEVFQALLQLSRREGATVVLVTHDLNLIRQGNALRVDRQIRVDAPHVHTVVARGLVDRSYDEQKAASELGKLYPAADIKELDGVVEEAAKFLSSPEATDFLNRRFVTRWQLLASQGGA